MKSLFNIEKDMIILLFKRLIVVKFLFGVESEKKFKVMF
jgi:hypothetical protein